MLNDCLFCAIAAGEIPSTKVYEDEFVYAFHDIAPKAPIHILVIPKTHVASAACITEENSHLVARCFEAISKITAMKGIKNFNVLSNCGEKAGQSVFHLHFHILAQEENEQ